MTVVNLLDMNQVIPMQNQGMTDMMILTRAHQGEARRMGLEHHITQVVSVMPVENERI
jgi:hypothetical protein